MMSLLNQESIYILTTNHLWNLSTWVSYLFCVWKKQVMLLCRRQAWPTPCLFRLWYVAAGDKTPKRTLILIELSRQFHISYLNVEFLCKLHSLFSNQNYSYESLQLPNLTKFSSKQLSLSQYPYTARRNHRTEPLKQRDESAECSSKSTLLQKHVFPPSRKIANLNRRVCEMFWNLICT